jgi:hypothetical protein
MEIYQKKIVENGQHHVTPSQTCPDTAVSPKDASLHGILSGLNLSPDCPFPIPKQARIGLRLKITSNRACFAKRAK